MEKVRIRFDEVKVGDIIAPDWGKWLENTADTVSEVINTDRGQINLGFRNEKGLRFRAEYGSPNEEIEVIKEDEV